MKWWRIFESTVGAPGERPESYWHPGLGNSQHGPGLTADAIGDLNPAQLLAAYEYASGE